MRPWRASEKRLHRHAGRGAGELLRQSAHDQGYLNAVGISTANFGSGEQAFAHTDLDMASVDKTFDAAKVYAWMIASYLGPQ